MREITTDAASATVWERLRGVAIFVAIVWGVAASFVAFELLALIGADALSSSDLALPAAVQRSTICDVPDNGTTAPPAVQATAWLLGVRIGSHARAATSLGDGAATPGYRQAEEWLASAAERLSTELGVPAPTRFVPASAVNAIVEFGPFVENAPNPTAQAIATAHGRRTCEIYKLGAYWGYSLLVRAALLGTRNVFAVEIRHYARRLAIPEALWQPMLAPTEASVSAEQRVREADAITNGVATYLNAAR